LSTSESWLVRTFRGRRWMFYLVVLLPIALFYSAARLFGQEIWEWIGGITFAAAFGSIVATEITFVQIRLRPRDMVRGLVEELASTEQGRQAQRILNRLESLLAEVDRAEVRRYVRQGKRMARMAMADLREVLEFIHAFAERQRRFKSAKRHR